MKKLSQFFNAKVNIGTRQIVILTMFFLINSATKGQTTYTATEVMVTNSITAGGAIRGQCITANDTLRAKDDVVPKKIYK
ncbi:MAG: hypothetical protein Q8L81_13935 [Bacteroidota bacterium]|nr:hypothetical protein [Bacteroidota bacterium]